LYFLGPRTSCLTICALLVLGSCFCSANLRGCFLSVDLEDSFKDAVGTILKQRINHYGDDYLRSGLNISQFTSQTVCSQAHKKVATILDTLLFYEENENYFTLFKKLVSEMTRLENISDFKSQQVLNELIKKLQVAMEGYLSVIETMPGKIADLVMEKKFIQALSLLRNADGILQQELMRKSVTLVYERGDLIKAIKMAEYGNTYINSYAGFQSVFEQMKEKSESNKLEVLLLQFYIVGSIEYVNFESQPVKVKEDYNKLRSEVDVPVENVIVSLAEDIGKRSYERTEDVGNRFGGVVLEMFILRIIRNFFSPGTLSQAAVLVKYVVNLPYLYNKCTAGEEIYIQMKQRNQLESFEAFMHWIQIRKTIYHERYFMGQYHEVREKCYRVYDEQKANAEKHIDQFLQLYDSGSYEANVTSRTKEYPYTFHWIVEDVVRKRYNGSPSNVDKLITFFDAFHSLKVNCLGSAFLASEMRNNQQDSSEVIRAYKVMHTSIIKSPQDLHDLDFLVCLKEKENTPSWITRLVFKDTSACKIINKDDQSLLSVLETTDYSIRTLQTNTNDANNSEILASLWNIEVAESGIVSFQNKLFPEVFLSTQNDTAIASTSKFLWRTDGGSAKGYMRIFTLETSSKGTIFY
jgi:hypothetical protein